MKPEMIIRQMLLIVFSALEGFEISSVDDTWVNIRDSIKVGVLETYRNKPWFDLECSELANKGKPAKLL